MHKGVDVSHWQGNIDWKAAKSDGVEFCWIKSSESTGYKDKKYLQNREGCRKNRIPSGSYHFLQPNTDPKAQARHWFKTAGPHVKGDLRPAIDFEVRGVSHNWFATFLYEATRLFQIEPVLYTGRPIVIAHPWLSQYTHLALWWAAYPGGFPPFSKHPKITPWRKLAVWQYTSRLPVRGIGPCDGNHCPDLTPILIGTVPVLVPEKPKENDMVKFVRRNIGNGNGPGGHGEAVYLLNDVCRVWIQDATLIPQYVRENPLLSSHVELYLDEHVNMRPLVGAAPPEG